MYKIAVFAVSSLIIISLTLLIFFSTSAKPTLQQNPIAIINHQHVIQLLLAQTNEARALGLSYRTSLAADQGMLFIFPEANQSSFWMNEMLFPLDILWIREGRIVDLSLNVPPPAQTNNVPVTVYPKTAYTHVIEITAGWSEQHQIQINQPVEFQLLPAP